MTTADWERVMEHEAEQSRATPLLVCLDCGHQVCPYCRDWCDMVLNDGELCCEGECRYE